MRTMLWLHGYAIGHVTDERRLLHYGWAPEQRASITHTHTCARPLAGADV